MSVFDKVKDVDNDDIFKEKLGRVELRQQNLDYQDSLWHAKNIEFSGEKDPVSGIQMFDFDSGQHTEEFKNYIKSKNQTLKSVGNPRDLHYDILGTINTRKLGKLAKDRMEGALLGNDLSTYIKGDWKKSKDPVAMMMNLDSSGKMIVMDGKPLSPYFLIGMAQDNMDEIYAEKGFKFGNMMTEPDPFTEKDVKESVTNSLRNYILSPNSKFKVVDKPKAPKK